MPWPLSQDYNEAIQSPETSFADAELRGGHAITNALGMPMPRSGNFADVYEFIGASGAKWAVKCFTREVSGLQDRYHQIDLHLLKMKPRFTVGFQYQSGGIRIHGQWYPILKMEWIEGSLLNEFVRENLETPSHLDGLMRIWLTLAKRLREANLAHADLQHGNILLVPGQKQGSLTVRLIDYDGMFVPALAAKDSGEVGHPNYQHPQRLREGIYTAEIDRFPLLVVATALRALSVGGREVWKRYDNGDNLLFREVDLAAPGNSALFKELHNFTDPQTRLLAEALHKAAEGNIDDVPKIDDLFPEPKRALEPVTSANVPETAVTPAPILAPTPAPASPLDFTEPDAPCTPPPKHSGVPMWAWFAGAGAVVGLVLAVAGVGIAILVYVSRDRNKDNIQAKVADPKKPSRPVIDLPQKVDPVPKSEPTPNPPPGKTEEPAKVIPVKGDPTPIEDAPIDPQPRVIYQYDPRMSFGLTVVKDPAGKPIRKLLTYSPLGDTNHTLVRIDGQDLPLGAFGGQWQERDRRDGNRSMSTWVAKGVHVRQILEIVPSKQAVEVAPGQRRRLLNTCLVRYEIENKDGKDHAVGLRIMVDTLIGTNDGVPFAVPTMQGMVNTFKDFATADQVPDFIQALEIPNLANPGTVGHMTLKLGGDVEPPSRVVLTAWTFATPNLAWNVPVRNMGRDSAVVLYWNADRALKPNEKRNLGFAYGLGQVAGGEGTGKLALTVNGTFLPGGTFTVTAYVQKPVAGQTLTIELPKGFDCVRCQETEPVPAATVGAEGSNTSTVTWTVRAGERGNYQLRVRSSTGIAQTQPLAIRLE